MTTERHETRRTNASALRTLGVLERTLKRHAHELMGLECEDADAAEAILLAVRAVDGALDNTKTVLDRIREDDDGPMSVADED